MTNKTQACSKLKVTILSYEVACYNSRWHKISIKSAHIQYHNVELRMHYLSN